MKKRIWFVLLCCMLMIAPCALAGGYENGDNWGRAHTGTGGIAVAEVISKSVTLRDAPSMLGTKIVSIPGEEQLMVLERVLDDWAKVEWSDGKGRAYEGYVRTEYIVINPEYITLRRSNTPAYSAPTRESKLVGSLSKMTRLRVLGSWGEYYIVYLRGGSAFIRMDAGVWTETQLSQLRESTYVSALGGHRGSAARKTSLRTGAGEDWPEIMEIASGTTLDVSAREENGWVFVKDLDGNAGYVRSADLK